RLRALCALAHGRSHWLSAPARRPHRPDRSRASGTPVMQALEEPVAAPVAAVARRRPWSVFSSGPFRKLWLATMLSLVGDFFSYVAMAWLVLQLTGSSFALGTVLV